MGRFASLWVWIPVTLACSSPTPPAASLEADVPAGKYRLRASPLVSPHTGQCSDGDRYIGVAIEALVTVTHEGDALVARSSTPENGDLEMRLSASGSHLGTTTVSGTARGTAIDRRDESTVGTATLTFLGVDGRPADLTGRVHTSSTPHVAGNATGTFLAESILGSEVCQFAQWGLFEIAGNDPM